MASIRHVGDMWRADVCVDRKRFSRRFPGRAQARDWALKIEQELRWGCGEPEAASGRTVADALKRYEREVSPTKKGARWESVRIALILRDELANVSLDTLSSADLAAWRDRRLGTVSGPSVAREMNLIGHVFTIARKEWCWLERNPMSDVRRPKQAPPRDRRVSPEEIERIKVATGYSDDTPPKAAFARVGAAFLFAIETAMRCGEICGLTWDDVDCDGRVATLHDTKNGWKREVPLSHAAVAILDAVGKARGRKNPIFGLNSERTSALFRKAKASAGIENLTFHDSRHEAITRLAAKLDVLDLARMVGHRDIRMLQVYYNRSARDIALDL
jgi:integrase